MLKGLVVLLACVAGVAVAESTLYGCTKTDSFVYMYDTSGVFGSDTGDVYGVQSPPAVVSNTKVMVDGIPMSGCVDMAEHPVTGDTYMAFSVAGNTALYGVVLSDHFPFTGDLQLSSADLAVLPSDSTGFAFDAFGTMWGVSWARILFKVDLEGGNHQAWCSVDYMPDFPSTPRLSSVHATLYLSLEEHAARITPGDTPDTNALCASPYEVDANYGQLQAGRPIASVVEMRPRSVDMYGGGLSAWAITGYGFDDAHIQAVDNWGGAFFFETPFANVSLAYHTPGGCGGFVEVPACARTSLPSTLLACGRQSNWVFTVDPTTLRTTPFGSMKFGFGDAYNCYGFSTHPDTKQLTIAHAGSHGREVSLLAFTADTELPGLDSGSSSGGGGMEYYQDPVHVYNSMPIPANIGSIQWTKLIPGWGPVLLASTGNLQGDVTLPPAHHLMDLSNGRVLCAFDFELLDGQPCDQASRCASRIAELDGHFMLYQREHAYELNMDLLATMTIPDVAPYPTCPHTRHTQLDTPDCFGNSEPISDVVDTRNSSIPTWLFSTQCNNPLTIAYPWNTAPVKQTFQDIYHERMIFTWMDPWAPAAGECSADLVQGVFWHAPSGRSIMNWPCESCDSSSPDLTILGQSYWFTPQPFGETHKARYDCV